MVDDRKEASFGGMSERKRPFKRLGSAARISGQPKTGVKRRRNETSQGSIPGGAQVLAAYAAKPGRLTSLARRGKPGGVER
jgi:hypothetical protein